MKTTPETNSIDRIQGEKFIRSELAIECIAEMAGYAARELLEEEKKHRQIFKKLPRFEQKKMFIFRNKNVFMLVISISRLG